MSEGFGGAIDNRGTLIVKGTTDITVDEGGNYTGGALFKGNHSYSSGAVNVYDGTATFENVRFEDNKSEGGGGGAIKISTSEDVEFEKTVFKGNTTSNNGGAIYIVKADEVTIVDSEFIGNTSGTNGGGAIYLTEGTLNLSGENYFSKNKENSKQLDIRNLSTVNIVDGITTIGGGIGNNANNSIIGNLNIQNGMLKLDADADDGTVRIDNKVLIGGVLDDQVGVLYVVDKALITNTVVSNNGVIGLAENAVLTVEVNHADAALSASDIGKMITVNGGIESQVTLNNTQADSLALGGTGNSEINVGTLTIDSAGYGIQTIAGTHTITTDKVNITAANGGAGIMVQGQTQTSDTGVTITGFKDGLTITKKPGADQGYAIYNLDHESGNTKGSFVTIDGVGAIKLEGDNRAAVAVLGETAKTTIKTTSTIDITSDITEATGNRKGSVLYVNGGQLDIEGAEVSITDNGATKTAIGIAAGGELTLKAADKISVAGNIVTANKPEDNASYGTTEQNPHVGKFTLAGGAMTVDGTVSSYSGLFEQTGGSLVLTDATGFFAGNVNVNGGVLQYGDVDTAMAPVAVATFAVGDSLTLNADQVINVGMTSAEVPALLSVGSQLNIRSGALLLIDSDSTIKGDGFSIEEGSQIHIVDAETGKRVLDFDHDLNFEGVDITANRLVTVTLDKDGYINVKANSESALIQNGAGAVNTLMAIAENGSDTDSPNMGMRFLSRAIDGIQYPISETEAIETINEVSRASITANVQNTALRISDIATDSVLNHMSLNGQDCGDSPALWVVPMYGNLYSSGMVTKDTSVRSQFGGVAIGAEMNVADFMNGKFYVGMSFNAGAGQSKINGTATKTENDYDFVGVNVYGAWNNSTVNLIGNIGYGFGMHEFEMGLPTGLDMSTVSCDVDTSVLSASLRAEYLINVNGLNVLPHVGVNFSALRTDSHELKSGGNVLNRFASETQHIWQFPVGVTVKKDFEVDGWNVKPMADVSVVLAAGDKQARTQVNYSGLDTWDSSVTRMMDTTNWAGSFGIEAQKDNFTLGLNYHVQTSDHETNQSVYLNLSWKF